MTKPSLPSAFATMADLRNYLAQVDAWLRDLEGKTTKAFAMASLLTGNPGGGPVATLSIPHVDSWLFEDNVDSTHPANLRFVIPAPTQRIATARLSIHLAAFRTYSSFSVSATGASTGHSHSHGHASPSHAHTIPIDNGPFTNAVGQNAAGGNLADGFGPTTAPVNATTPGSTGGDATGESGHTHAISGSSFLGVSEGATATGVTISFDGVDTTAALGGPFNADVVELDVTKFLPTSKGAWHVIGMQPSGLGRIEAHLRLSLFVNAAAGF